MINQWGVAERSLDALAADLGAEAAPIRCEILLLRAELALCGPIQNTNACIALCNSVVGMTDNVELLSRAYGHRGLAHLAAYHPGEAEAWLHAAIDVAKKHGHPHCAYEALHWLSKKKIACLELDDAWAALTELANMSESSGVAQGSPFHRRDASRVLALKGDASQAGFEFVEYFDALDVIQDQDRALTVLVCQIVELDSLFGREASGELLAAIAESAQSGATQTPAHARLAAAVCDLRARHSVRNVAEYAVAVLGVAADEARASEAIFRFDVPDLAELRKLVTGQ
jgi:hypothetical protein